VFNASAIQTIVCCQLTTNLFRAQAPGNILLRKGEGNLAKPSVVNISQVVTFDKSHLQEKIGTLSKERVADIIDGLMLLLEPREI
jgi:mRNA interferase MazF